MTVEFEPRQTNPTLCATKISQFPKTNFWRYMISGDSRGDSQNNRNFSSSRAISAEAELLVLYASLVAITKHLTNRTYSLLFTLGTRMRLQFTCSLIISDPHSSKFSQLISQSTYLANCATTKINVNKTM